MLLSDPKILTEFQKAQQGSRHDFLTKLTSHFHPSDWHHIHSLLSARSYYVDFLTALPIELSLQIILYLPQEQTILLRAVSHSYYNLLTSPEVCSFLAHSLYPLSTPPTSSWRTHYENLLSRRLFFRRGRPSSFEKIPGAQSPTALCAETFALASVVDNTKVQVHLLTTSPVTLLLPPRPMSNRTSISHVALTSSIVAALAGINGNCQVWDLSTKATHTFRLPSSWINAVHGSGYILAIAVKDDLVIHDAAKKQTKIFESVLREIPVGSSTESLYLVVHEDTHRVWAVSSGPKGVILTALCLDTGATVVPMEKFNTLRGRLRNTGSGVWMVEEWKLRVGGLTWAALCIDVGHTTGAVSFLSKNILISVREFEIWDACGTVGTCGDITWACGGGGLGIVWDNSTLRARAVSIDAFADDIVIQCERGKWELDFICENFVLVTDQSADAVLNVAILRFGGIHEGIQMGPASFWGI